MTDHPGDPKPAEGDPADDGTPAVAPPEADVPWGETPTDGGRPSQVTASDAGRPEVVEPETSASDVTDTEARATEATASKVAAASVAGSGAPTTDAPDGYAAADGTGPSDRPVPDPHETTRLPITPPAPDRRVADTAPSVDPSAAAPPTRPAGTRVGAALFFDDRLGDTEHTTYPHDAELHDADDAAGHTLVDDEPTEAMAVVEPGGRHRAEPGDDVAAAEWRPPRQTSRVTVGLVAALLVVLGFLAGVLVGRTAAPNSASDQPARPAATASTRPGA